MGKRKKVYFRFSFGIAIINCAGIIKHIDGVFAIQIPCFDEMKVAGIIKEAAVEFDNDKTLFGGVGNATCFNHNLPEYYNMFNWQQV